MVGFGRDDGRQVILGETEELPIDQQEEWNEQAWLKLLEQELDRCHQAADIGAVQKQIMAPEKQRASKQGWKKAEEMVSKAVERL